jgi:hypothetical protein
MRYLHETGHFRSLTYLDMPFVLMPNVWKRFSSPKKVPASKERAHKDGILVDFDSPEALEEVFWKVFCEKEYIFNDKLQLHHVNDSILEKFKKYIYNVLLSSDSPNKTRYLSKNNNNVLRFDYIHKVFPKACFVIPFREPLQHALSLLKQHTHFSEIQAEDKFTLDYMNWLGHYEFGLNQKTFLLKDDKVFKEMSLYKKTDINFWLLNWKNYYQYVNNHHMVNSFFLSHEKLSSDPSGVLSKLFSILDIQLPAIQSESFLPGIKPVESYDQNLLKECNSIYKQLEDKFYEWYKSDNLKQFQGTQE